MLTHKAIRAITKSLQSYNMIIHSPAFPRADAAGNVFVLHVHVLRRTIAVMNSDVLAELTKEDTGDLLFNVRTHEALPFIFTQE